MLQSGAVFDPTPLPEKRIKRAKRVRGGRSARAAAKLAAQNPGANLQDPGLVELCLNGENSDYESEDDEFGSASFEPEPEEEEFLPYSEDLLAEYDNQQAAIGRHGPEFSYIKELLSTGMPDPNEGESPCEPYTGMSAELAAKFDSLLASFPEVFRKPPPGVPPPRSVEHKIDIIPGSAPAYTPPQRLSFGENTEASKQVAELLEMDNIEVCQSPWSASIMFARKKNGSLRMVFDYRKLNAVTVKSRHPIPRIDDCLDATRGCNIFSKVDLVGAYHRMAMRETDRDYTAFSCKQGQFRWKVMPFGLCNAPASFSELMNVVMKGTEEIAAFYLDDIIVFSKTPEEHLLHLEQILTRLRDHHLYCQLDKCAFRLSKVDFLGHVITAKGVGMDDRKVRAVKIWPVPLNPTDVKRFLGLVGYYRKFVSSFAQLALPMSELLKETTEWVWGEKEQQSFEAVRDAICREPVLQIPDPTLPFQIECDASGVATGAVLVQDQGKGFLPCAYASKKFSETETRWTVHEQEALAVIRALSVIAASGMLAICKRACVYVWLVRLSVPRILSYKPSSQPMKVWHINIVERLIS
jgi:hypothetical protein